MHNIAKVMTDKKRASTRNYRQEVDKTRNEQGQTWCKAIVGDRHKKQPEHNRWTTQTWYLLLRLNSSIADTPSILQGHYKGSYEPEYVLPES